MLKSASLTQLHTLRKSIEDHIEFIASGIGPRNTRCYDKLLDTAAYIKKNFSECNVSMTTQSYMADSYLVENIIAEVKGSEFPDEIIVVGAHYDTVIGSPGADDNTSGVAGLLELCRQLAEKPLKHTFRFVAFVNEEPPYFDTELMGSFQYAKMLYDTKQKIVGMVSLESIGYYSEEKNSQQYPLQELKDVFPDQGNFIGFISDETSVDFLQRMASIFKSVCDFPMEYLSAPVSVPGIGLSDQLSFWRYDYPAIMITGTAPFRNPHYHRHSDVLETLDLAKTTKLVSGLYDTFLLLDNEIFI